MDATFLEDIFLMRDMHNMSGWKSAPIPETPMEFAEEADDESSYSGEGDNELPQGARDKEMQNILVIILLCTSCMILTLSF
jgi:hypothetical protein